MRLWDRVSQREHPGLLETKGTMGAEGGREESGHGGSRHILRCDWTGRVPWLRASESPARGGQRTVPPGGSSAGLCSSLPVGAGRTLEGRAKVPRCQGRKGRAGEGWKQAPGVILNTDSQITTRTVCTV